MIRVNNDFVIDVDQLNYTAKVDLHKVVTDKDGNTRDSYKVIGYYSTLKGAVKGILDYEVKDTLSKGEKSLNEAINELNKVNDRLEDILNRIEEDDLK